MDLHSETVKLSEITVHFDMKSLTAMQLRLSNGVESPILSNCTEHELSSQLTKTIKLDPKHAVDRVLGF